MEKNTFIVERIQNIPFSFNLGFANRLSGSLTERSLVKDLPEIMCFTAQALKYFASVKHNVVEAYVLGRPFPMESCQSTVPIANVTLSLSQKLRFFISFDILFGYLYEIC